MFYVPQGRPKGLASPLGGSERSECGGMFYVPQDRPKPSMRAGRSPGPKGAFASMDGRRRALLPSSRWCKEAVMASPLRGSERGRKFHHPRRIRSMPIRRLYTAYSTSVAVSSTIDSAAAMPQLTVLLA